MYDDDDLQKMRVICFLRGLGFSIRHIQTLLAEEQPQHVIALLLAEQEQTLRDEITERQEQLQSLETLRHALRGGEFSVKSIGDIAFQMKAKKTLTRMRWTMLALGAVMNVIEIGTIVWWVKTGAWLPFAAGIPLVVAIGVWISVYYYQRVAYICPECHTVFHPKFGKMFWASHTPNTRKLTCPHCGHRGYCVEVYRDPKQSDAPL